MPELYLECLRIKLKTFKQQSKENAQMFCYLNDENIAKLLNQAKCLKGFFRILKANKEEIEELNNIIKELEEFLDFVNKTNSSRKGETL